MPEVTVRKRVGKRSGTLSYRLNRWYFRNRPQVAVVVVFIVFALTGFIVAKVLLPSTSIETPATAPAPPAA
ncbi:MAG: hypothetical protein WCL08_02055 [Verrucomicrobiota bacterium]